MPEKPDQQSTTGQNLRRKKKLKYIKRNITRSQFHYLLEKAAQPVKKEIIDD